MTNGEKIKEIFSDCFIVRRLSDNKIVHLVCTEEFLNSEYKEPTTKNDLGVDCIDKSTKCKHECIDNVLGVDCISREAALEPYKILENTDTLSVYTIRQNLAELPSMGRYDPYTDKFIKE